jgi:twitching motility protein PilT
MQHFDGEIERLIRENIISVETGMHYATNQNNLRLQISDVIEDMRKDGQAVAV